MSDARYGGFTLRVDCRSCGQPIPVNLPEATVHCDHCQGDGELPSEMWRGVLREFDESHEAFETNRTASKTLELGGWIVHVARRRATPACEKCNALYPADRISDHSARDFFCVACGDPGSTYPRPAWLGAHARTAVQIILTEPRGPGVGANANAVAVPDAPRPVIMQCPGCGGPLSITPASPRTVRCDHCRAEVYLPDDLWRRLHPAKTMREWYVRFEGQTDKQLAEEERRRAESAEDAARGRRHAEESEANARRDVETRKANAHREAEARARAAEDARAHDEAVRRAKRSAYLGLLPLYATIGSIVVMFVAGDVIDVELPSAAFVVGGGVQLFCAGFAAFMVAKPIKVALRAGGDQMVAYHWLWVIFSLFVFPFGPIVFFVGLKRFTGSFGAGTMKSGGRYTSIAAAKLSKHESWPAAFFFLAMSLGVASEIAAAAAYGQSQTTTQQQKPPSKRGR